MPQGLKSDYYHAGMTAAQKLTVQTLWQLGRVKVVCATIAYGMGVDNPNVRYVVHFTVPKCMEGYYQVAATSCCVAVLCLMSSLCAVPAGVRACGTRRRPC